MKENKSQPIAESPDIIYPSENSDTVTRFQLHGDDNLEVHLSSSTGPFNREMWSEVTGDKSLFLSLPYLQAAEKSSLPGMQFRYAILTEASKPVAIIYFQLVNLSDSGLGGILNLDEYGGLASSISNRINDLLFSPGNGKNSYLLVCGNLLVSGEHGIAAIDDEAFLKAIHAIAPLKKYITRSLGSSAKIVAMMVKDFYNHLDKLAAPVLKHDYFLLHTDPEMIFMPQAEWDSFDDYLASLSSKYRLRAKNAIAKLDNLIVRDLSLEEINMRKEEIYKLNAEVMKKAPVKLARPSESYFVNLKKEFGSFYNIRGFFLDEKMIAFTSALHNKNHFEAHFIGMEYQYNKEYCLYQNILYSYIREAIESKCQHLYFGRTALEIKSTVGARPYDLGCYFRFANKVINALAKPLVSSTGPGKWIPRDPFKSE